MLSLWRSREGGGWGGDLGRRFGGMMSRPMMGSEDLNVRSEKFYIIIVWVGTEFGVGFFGAVLYGVWVATTALYIYHTARDRHHSLISISRFDLSPLLFRFCETACPRADLTR